MIQRIAHRLCPHWWTEKVYPDDVAIMYEVVRREKCVICGKRRIYARVPEPHPTRDKEELVAELQHSGHEFIVEEWLPYGSMGPPSEEST